MIHGYRLIVLLVLTEMFFLLPARAQDRDNWKRMDIPDAPARSAEEEKQTFKIAPGYRIELVAAEPLVVDPVVLRWDASGRMWVVEMRGFMPDVEGTNERKPVGKVAVLEDTDHDGRMDQRTTFMDELVLPRALALVEGGVLVGEPPHLWFCRDSDGDLKADEQVKLTRHGKRGPEVNIEYLENGLRWTLTNWFYNGTSDRKFQFRYQDGNPELIEQSTSFRGQWGIAQNNYGRLFYNTNSNYLSADTFPRNLKTLGYRLSDARIQSKNIAGDQKVHSIRVNPGINRGYRSGMLGPDGRLARTTAVSGQCIYRGDQFSKDMIGDAIIPEPAGNAVAHFDIKGTGDQLTAVHRTYEDNTWNRREFLASRDERFRPVNVENGPDGALYIVDLYRGILQHKIHVTDYLREQILARNLDEPVGLGRIWRVVETDRERRSAPEDLSKKSSRELLRLLGHPNAWHRDWAQRLLVRRAPADLVDELKQSVQKAKNHLARIHALWTLEGMDKLDEKTVQKAVSDSHRQVRVAAARTRDPAPINYRELDRGRIEAERAQKVVAATVKTVIDGYTGEGYVDFQSKSNDVLQWKISNVPAGTYSIQFRYGLAGSPRPVKFMVNETVVEEQLALPPTGDWSSWKQQEVEVKLKDGQNTIRLEATGTSGPNFDHIRLIQKK